MNPSYETIAAQSGHYPFVEVYQFLGADVYQFTGAGDSVAERSGPAKQTVEVRKCFSRSFFCLAFA
jgi:hypothetical protein